MKAFLGSLFFFLTIRSFWLRPFVSFIYYIKLFDTFMDKLSNLFEDVFILLLSNLDVESIGRLSCCNRALRSKW